MNRQEFLKKLEKALEGEVSPRVIQSNIQYYQNYILDEMRKGRNEQEVLDELGDPRLIARTIFDSQEAAEGSYGEENYAYDEQDIRDSSYTWAEDMQEDSEAEDKLSGIRNKVRPALILTVVVIVLILVLALIFGMAVAVLTSPVFWVVVGIGVLWNIFGR